MRCAAMKAHVSPTGAVQIAVAALAFAQSSPAADALERGFAQPPASTKPWVYWYWISDNI